MRIHGIGRRNEEMCFLIFLIVYNLRNIRNRKSKKLSDKNRKLIEKGGKIK